LPQQTAVTHPWLSNAAATERRLLIPYWIISMLTAHLEERCSQINGVPCAMSQTARRPSSCSRCRVCKPLPGRIERMFFPVNISPAFVFSTTNSDRRKRRLACSLSRRVHAVVNIVKSHSRGGAVENTPDVRIRAAIPRRKDVCRLMQPHGNRFSTSRRRMYPYDTECRGPVSGR
jgi:hypothetical protein